MLVHDNICKPHGFWRTTRVNQLLTDKDELIRGAIVRITSGRDQVTELRQTFQLLYPLEVDCCVSQLKKTDKDGEGENLKDVTTDHNETRGGKDVGNLTVGRPLRAAAEQSSRRS